MAKKKVAFLDTYSERELKTVLKMYPGKKMVVEICDDSNLLRVDLHHEDGKVDYAIPLPPDVIRALAIKYPGCKIVMALGDRTPKVPPV